MTKKNKEEKVNKLDNIIEAANNVDWESKTHKRGRKVNRDTHYRNLHPTRGYRYISLNRTFDNRQTMMTKFYQTLNRFRKGTK